MVTTRDRIVQPLSALGLLGQLAEPGLGRLDPAAQASVRSLSSPLKRADLEQAALYLVHHLAAGLDLLHGALDLLHLDADPLDRRLQSR